MKIYAPDYYPKFHCIADACQHSCCVSWDVYIDDDTVQKYRSMKGTLGDRIRSHLTENDDGVCISMTSEGRCPFLNECGLCDIIIEKSNDYLSEICSEHPRFYNFFSDRTEVGIGLSCEEVARIILSQRDKTELIPVLSDDEEEEWELTEVEKLILENRQNIFLLLQDRSKPLDQRIDGIIRLYCDKPLNISIDKAHKMLRHLERLDRSWDFALDNLYSYGSYDPILDFELPFEKLVLYFIYRHVSKAENLEEFISALLFSLFSYSIIKALCNAEITKNGSCSFEMLCEIARQYSSEIEYSEENTMAILDFFMTK